MKGIEGTLNQLIAEPQRATEAGPDEGKNRVCALALARLNAQHFQDTGLFRVSLGVSQPSNLCHFSCLAVDDGLEHGCPTWDMARRRLKIAASATVTRPNSAM
jgi:hypothetical protein